MKCPCLSPLRLTPVLLGLQKDHLNQMDGYLVYGEEYKAIRDAVGHAMLQCKTPGIGTALTVGWSGPLARLVALLEAASCLHYAQWYRLMRRSSEQS